MHEAKRRDFLKAGIGAAVAMGSAWPLSVCRGLTPERSGEPKSQVAAIRGASLDSMTREAIDAIGGLHKVVDKGETPRRLQRSQEGQV